MICARYPGCTFVQSLPQSCIFYSNMSVTNCEVSFGPKDPDYEECFDPPTTSTTIQTTTTSTTTQTTTSSTTAQTTTSSATIQTSSTTIDHMTCMEPGQCVGNEISTPFASDYNACLKHCKKSDRCHWFTFKQSLCCTDCILFEDCPEINTAICPECLTSEKECGVAFGLKEQGFDKNSISIPSSVH